jgi:hypothetical protein
MEARNEDLRKHFLTRIEKARQRTSFRGTDLRPRQYAKSIQRCQEMSYFLR